MFTSLLSYKIAKSMIVYSNSVLSSTLVKFHPVKKFVLAVASFEGAVTLLDIQTKKKVTRSL